MNKTQNVELSKYSHGAGCGCKIAPDTLEKILENTSSKINYKDLIVGNNSKDDAAVYHIGDGKCVISTTDFFMPIVNDPYTFGRIAATNAISDIYAMGGKPIMAISIFGWPIDKLSEDVAGQVIAGGRSVCEEAGIPLAGGHSIDSPEPIFGLAVTGIVDLDKVKKNNSARANCKLYLTKPLGIGILTTAQKRGEIENDEINEAINAMTTLNKLGSTFSELDYVTAMTDVTGFGLLGHLTEICESSGISAVINFKDVPVLSSVRKYLERSCTPGGTNKNYRTYKNLISPLSEEAKNILYDPQTSGGLLVAVKEENEADFKKVLAELGLELKAIGYTTKKTDYVVNINE